MIYVFEFLLRSRDRQWVYKDGSDDNWEKAEEWQDVLENAEVIEDLPDAVKAENDTISYVLKISPNYGVGLNFTKHVAKVFRIQHYPWRCKEKQF